MNSEVVAETAQKKHKISLVYFIYHEISLHSLADIPSVPPARSAVAHASRTEDRFAAQLIQFPVESIFPRRRIFEEATNRENKEPRERERERVVLCPILKLEILKPRQNNDQQFTQ